MQFRRPCLCAFADPVGNAICGRKVLCVTLKLMKGHGPLQFAVVVQSTLQALPNMPGCSLLSHGITAIVSACFISSLPHIEAF